MNFYCTNAITLTPQQRHEYRARFAPPAMRLGDMADARVMGIHTIFASEIGGAARLTPAQRVMAFEFCSFP